MYKYIKSNEAERKPNIGDIWLLMYCDDINDSYPTDIMSSVESYSDDQEDLDIMYLTSPDDELKKLSAEEIQNIQNLSLIQRIGHLGNNMYNKLSQEQRAAYVEYAKNYHWLTKKEIPEVVVKIRGCARVDSLYPRRKNDTFRQKYNLDDPELLKIVHNIKVSDFDESTSQLSYHKDYYGDQVLVFNVDGIEPPNGIDLSTIRIYIKLDYSHTTDSSVAYFSIHES